MFLNRRDLKTFSTGLGTLEKLKIFQKLQRNQVFLRIKSLGKSITRTIGHKTITYRDKRQKRSFYRDLDLKRLRSTGLNLIKLLGAYSVKILDIEPCSTQP